MNAITLALLLLGVVPANQPPTEDAVEVVQFNTVFGGEGELYHRLIFWDYYPETPHDLHVVDVREWFNGKPRPQASVVNGRLCLTWYDQDLETDDGYYYYPNSTLRRVWCREFIDTGTPLRSPDDWDNDWFTYDHRRGLTRGNDFPDYPVWWE